jgi:hypothetical protein
MIRIRRRKQHHMQEGIKGWIKNILIMEYYSGIAVENDDIETIVQKAKQ